MRYDIKVGSISWINGTPSPVQFAASAKLLDPEWVPKTYIGLRATRNPPPPKEVSDFKAQQAKKHFRAMTYLHFRADIDRGENRVETFKVLDAFHDAGWTPPFDKSTYESTYLAALFDKDLDNPLWYQGEYSDLSVVYTQRRHQNTSITKVPEGELVLANAIIKFRAGAHTDGVGLRIGSPYHVPWVWNEWVLTCFKGDLKLYVRASKFPSHAWYFNGQQVHKVDEIGDVSFPMKVKPLIPRHIPRPPGIGVGPTLPTNDISVTALRLYPILSAGAPASGPQTANGAAEKNQTGAVDRHPNTGPGWAVKEIALPAP